MTQSTCAACGTTFVRAHRGRSIYCTPDCKREHYNAKARAKHRADPEHERAKQRAKYERGKPARRYTRLAQVLGSWVPPQTRPALPPGPALTKTCALCTQPHMRQGKYCGETCAANAKLIQDRARNRTMSLASRSFTAGYCGECGEAFITPGSRCDRFCSERCFKRNRRRRDKQMRSKRIKAGVKRQTIDLPRLAKRDGWRCHICHRKVTRKTWSHDHLIPLSAGGAHTWDNVALAHFLCNSIRGAHGHAQLLLVADAPE